EAAWSAATAGGQAPVDLASGGFLTLEDLHEQVRDAGGVWLSLSPFNSGLAEIAAETDDFDVLMQHGLAKRVAADAIASFQGNVEGAMDHVATLIADRWAVVLAAPGAGLVDRARDVISDRGIAARIVDDLTDVPEPGVVTLVRAEVENGFASAEAKLAVLRSEERRVGQERSS